MRGGPFKYCLVLRVKEISLMQSNLIMCANASRQNVRAIMNCQCQPPRKDVCLLAVSGIKSLTQNKYMRVKPEFLILIACFKLLSYKVLKPLNQHDRQETSIFKRKF